MITMLVLLTARTSIYVVVTISSENSPVLAKLKILLASIALLWGGKIITGTVWFNCIFILLLAGGVIVIFAVVASVIPNTKCYKEKTRYLLISLVFSSMLLRTLNPQAPKGSLNFISWYVYKFCNIETIALLILSYFILILWIISKEKISIRVI